MPTLPAVLDDDLLAQRFRHAGLDQPGGEVGGAAGGEGHDHADGLRRVGGWVFANLRTGRCAQHAQRRSAEQRGQ